MTRTKNKKTWQEHQHFFYLIYLCLRKSILKWWQWVKIVLSRFSLQTGLRKNLKKLRLIFHWAFFIVVGNSSHQSYSMKKDLRPATLLKQRLSHRCFPVNFAKFLRIPFLTEHLRWLLLDIFLITNISYHYLLTSFIQINFFIPKYLFSKLLLSINQSFISNLFHQNQSFLLHLWPETKRFKIGCMAQKFNLYHQCV